MSKLKNRTCHHSCDHNLRSSQLSILVRHELGGRVVHRKPRKALDTSSQHQCRASSEYYLGWIRQIVLYAIDAARQLILSLDEVERV